MQRCCHNTFHSAIGSTVKCAVTAPLPRNNMHVSSNSNVTCLEDILGSTACIHACSAGADPGLTV